jgi:uncharacterized protein YodC (DUF2158 family)
MWQVFSGNGNEHAAFKLNNVQTKEPAEVVTLKICAL